MESQEHTIKAEDKDGLTVNDLASFAKSCEANNIPFDVPVKARVNFGGRLVSVMATTEAKQA